MLRLCLLMLCLYASAYCIYFGNIWKGLAFLAIAILMFAQALFQGACDSAIETHVDEDV